MAKALNIIDTAMRSGVFQTFTRLLEGSSIEQRLRSQTYTLFAPADIAFAYLPSDTFNRILQAERIGHLPKLLSYHLVAGKIMSADLKNLTKLETIQGQDLRIDNSEELRIGGARLLRVDLEAKNGVIHTIDRLLIPPSFVDLSATEPLQSGSERFYQHKT